MDESCLLGIYALKENSKDLVSSGLAKVGVEFLTTAIIWKASFIQTYHEHLLMHASTFSWLVPYMGFYSFSSVFRSVYWHHGLYPSSLDSEDMDTGHGHAVLWQWIIRIKRVALEQR